MIKKIELNEAYSLAWEKTVEKEDEITELVNGEFSPVLSNFKGTYSFGYRTVYVFDGFEHNGRLVVSRIAVDYDTRDYILEGVTIYDKMEEKFKTLHANGRIATAAVDNVCALPWFTRYKFTQGYEDSAEAYLPEGGTLYLRDLISSKKERKVMRKKQDAVDTVMETVKEKVPSDFDDYLKKSVKASYIFFEKGNDTGYCTHCRKFVPIGKVSHKQEGRCPVCGNKVTFMNPSRYRKDLYDTGYTLLIQKTKDDRLVFRYFVTDRTLRHGSERSPEYHSREIVRTFLWKDDEGHTRAEDYSFYIKNNEKEALWHKGIYKVGSLYYHHEVEHFGPGNVYAKGLKTILKNSQDWKYSGLKDIFPLMKDISDTCNNFPMWYLFNLEANPWLEIIAKNGFEKLLLQLMGYEYYYFNLDMLDTTAKTPWGLFKMDKKTYKEKVAGRKDISMRQITILSKYPALSAEQADFFSHSSEQLETILTYTTPHKAERYVREHLKKDSSRELEYQVGEVTEMWSAYLKYASEPHFAGNNKVYHYDMKNTMVLFPKDLKGAHDREMYIHNIHESKVSLQKRMEKIEQLNSILEEVHKKYDFKEGEDFQIQAPEDGYEIIREGQIQHICVGDVRQGYLERMAEKKTVILFLRKQDEPEKPFVTMEVRDGRVVQVRGYRNETPDANVLSFVDEFKKSKKLA